MFPRIAAIKGNEAEIESGYKHHNRPSSKHGGSKSSFGSVTKAEVNKTIVKNCNKILTLVGAKSQLDTSEPDIEILDIPQRYRPQDIKTLSKDSGFSQETLRRLYRAFKAECPTGRMTEENFKQVFAKFFPDVSTSGPTYSHHVFKCLDTSGRGTINFEEFIKTLSLLTNGTLADKLVWIFHLYDVNKDGELCQADLEEITTAIFSIMSDREDAGVRNQIKKRVVEVWGRFGLENQTDRISLDQWKSVISQDSHLCQSILAWS